MTKDDVKRSLKIIIDNIDLLVLNQWSLIEAVNQPDFIASIVPPDQVEETSHAMNSMIDGLHMLRMKAEKSMRQLEKKPVRKLEAANDDRS